MSLDIIGRENLPNVFIKEISVDSATDNSFHIGVVTYIKDLKDGQSRFQWYENKSLRNNMKIMIVVSRSSKFNSVVSNGDYTAGFTPQGLKRIPGYSQDEVLYELIPLQNISKKQLSQEPQITEGGKLYTFGFRRKFLVKNTENISVFAATVLDTQQFSLEQNLDLFHDSVSSFHGAIAGEKVLENGNIQYSSTMFFNGDSPWGGPVHKRNEKYMVGSKHSVVDHAFLESKEMLNTKIKDYRLSYKSKPSLNKIEAKKVPLISSLYNSHNADGNLRASFTFDMKRLFIQNTKYGSLLLQLDEKIINSMLSKMMIKDIQIEREQVLLSHVSTRAGTSKPVARRILAKKTIINSHDFRPYRLRAKYRYYNSTTGRERQISRRNHSSNTVEVLKSSIMEIHNSNSYEYRTFTFSDLDLGQNSSGTYRYKLSLEMKDPTQEYAKEMLRELKSGFISFKLYGEKASKRVNYDFLLDKTKESYIKRMKGTSWINFIEIYLKYYDLLFDSSEADINRLGFQMVSLLNPRSVTLKSLSIFRSHYQFLLDYFMKYFNFSDSIFNEAAKRGNVNVNPHEGKFFWNHSFEKIHYFKSYVSSVSFVDEQHFSTFRYADMFPSLRKRDISNIANRQRNKFFNGNPAFTTKTVPGIERDLLSSLNNISDYMFAHLSPDSIRKRQYVFDLSNMERIDVLSFNRFYSQFVSEAPKQITNKKRPNRIQEELANRSRSSFYIKPLLKRAERKIDDLKVSDVLKNSKGATSVKQHSSINNTTIPKGTRNLFTSFESNIASLDRRSSTEFNLSSESNVLYSMMSSPKFTKQQLVEMPLQMKSLMGSKSQFSRANILSSRNDLLASPLTKDLINLLFFTLIKIEFLEGYEKDSRGIPNLKKPIWTLLTAKKFRNMGQTSLCRMSFYNNQTLKINRSPLRSFKIQNRFFYISRRHLSDSLSDQVLADSAAQANKLSAAYDLIQNSNEHPIEYAQSIIVRQTSNKDGPLGFIDYGLQQQQNEANNDFIKIDATKEPQTEMASPSPTQVKPDPPRGDKNVY